MYTNFENNLILYATTSRTPITKPMTAIKMASVAVTPLREKVYIY